MKRILNWFLDHLKLVFTILVFGITFLVIGLVMLTSYTSYQRYEKNYAQTDLITRSLSPALPTSIEINDKFKSEYGKKLSFNADADEIKVTTSQEEYLIDGYIDLTKTGGSISITLELEKMSFVDIVFTVGTEYQKEDGEETIYGVKDLLTNAGFVVNGELMEEVVDLENNEGELAWHKLVMSGFALPAGEVKVTISNVNNKNAMMPKLQNITFFSSQKLTVPSPASEE